jgi:methyl-accepting chemotaxis protein-like sensor
MTDIVGALEGLCAAVFAPLLVMAEMVTAALPARRRPVLADLAAVEALARAELLRPHTLITGTGLVADPSLIADAPWHLAWWTVDQRRVEPLRVVSDPALDGFRDYTVLEWWAVPKRTGQRHITGPYVDYLCTDAYTLTFTVPVHHRGELAGVVGSDVYAARAERILRPALRAAGRPATVVNTAGRVVASTHPEHATGAPVRPGAEWVREDLPDAPFSVFTLA